MFSFYSISPGNFLFRRDISPLFLFRKHSELAKILSSSRRTLKKLLATLLRYFSIDPLYLFPKSTYFP